MAKLNAQQANELAANFLGLAQAIGDYRFNNWKTLSRTDNQRLGNMQWSILNSGEDMLALSTNLVMTDVQGSLKQISNITVQIRTSIQKLSNVQKAIKIAASLVTLASAIISKSPGGIVDGIQAVQDTWKA
jgi:hypothetical protein